jgi:extracellular factor (EF) 3-hydroxypalmitic acid methyl ester biosynthesis protein
MVHSAFAMNTVYNGNGNGNAHSGLIPKPRKQTAPPPAVPSTGTKDTQISFHLAGETMAFRGIPVRITRHAIVFEMFSPHAVPRLSEVLEEFNISLHDRLIYSGRAVIRHVMDMGAKVVCEATLEETGWQNVDGEALGGPSESIAGEFNRFLEDWQKFYKVAPEFKVIVADMQTFFHDLRLWLDGIGLRSGGLGGTATTKHETTVLSELGNSAIPAIDALFQRFEEVSLSVPEDRRAYHAHYMRRCLHPLVMAAPFANRTFNKPRGYAGDYEMINMILRNGFEGGSVFGKIVHKWFVKQAPAEAHRNRISYLSNRIETELCRIVRSGRKAHVFNFACGPAVEIQDFLRRSPMRDQGIFTLVDFDQETLTYANECFARIKSELHTDSRVTFHKKNVHHLIKESLKPNFVEKGKYDFVYCAGLFDYLSHSACKQLMDILYDMLAPDGILVATNVAPSNPMRHGMEHLLDWHLIYRDKQDMRHIAPAKAHDDDISILADSTGVNLFIEVRKPAYA